MFVSFHPLNCSSNLNKLLFYRYVRETEETAVAELDRLKKEMKELTVYKPAALCGSTVKFHPILCCCDAKVIWVVKFPGVGLTIRCHISVNSFL